jgi:hypothetical protein
VINLKLALSLAVAAVAAPALAGQDPAPAATASAKPDAAPDAAKEKKICTRQAATGSIMGKRVCRTVREIEAEQAAAQTQLDRMHSNSLPGNR